MAERCEGGNDGRGRQHQMDQAAEKEARLTADAPGEGPG